MPQLEEMSVSLLKTKLSIPVIRPDLVSRARLVERLDAGLLGEGGGFARKLTLVSAPAGSGKTTLLTEWVTQREHRAAWLSLDEHDNDETRFWRYVIASLQTLHDDLGQSAMQLLQAPQRPGTQALLTPLLNAIAAFPQGLVLILDDYHVISERPIHEGVGFCWSIYPRPCTSPYPPAQILRCPLTACAPAAN
jgi:LuxR family maltose regulon positive regulatory protein